MTIEKTTIQVREETTGKIYNVEISTENLIYALQGGNTNYLWLYINGWIDGEKNFKK